MKHIKAGAGHHKGGKHTRAGGADLKWEERWVKSNKTGSKTIKKWNKDNRSQAYKPTNVETASWTIDSHHHPPVFIPTWKSVHQHVICTCIVEMLIWHTWTVHIKCLHGLRKHTIPAFYLGDWPGAMSPCRLTYRPLQLNLEAELIIYLGERQYVRRLMSDNSALWWKGQDEQKKVFRLQPNHWLPWCSLWISSLWIRCRIISHGLIQSAILNACATGHYSGEDRLSVIVSLISNWRLVIFMQLLVAQTSLCVCVCVRLSCVILCLQTSVWPLFTVTNIHE